MGIFSAEESIASSCCKPSPCRVGSKSCGNGQHRPKVAKNCRRINVKSMFCLISSCSLAKFIQDRKMFTINVYYQVVKFCSWYAASDSRTTIDFFPVAHNCQSSGHPSTSNFVSMTVEIMQIQNSRGSP